MSYTGSLYQDGQRVAAVYGPNRKSVAAEIAHYALMYGQDGPVKVVVRKNPTRRKAARGARRKA